MREFSGITGYIRAALFNASDIIGFAGWHDFFVPGTIILT
jgi:hypothetical protein